MSVHHYEALNKKRKEEGACIKVAAYCRVSTEQEDQANSFENQQRFFLQYIRENPRWKLYGIFADEGISGTSTKKRKEFNRMIACARNREFDLILTKEISRFARNTLDSIYYTRELKRYGVGVLFLNDQINTLDGDGELRLAILSSIAQEESRRTSERVKWGQKRQMEQGVVFGRALLGYDVREGKLYINETGARVVRLIFHKFTEEKKGTYVIARELEEAGILTVRNCKTWSCSSVLRILRNEKYCGDLVQKKTYTPDFLSHEKRQNQGEEEFVILKNHHPPIISREVFEKANELLDARALSQTGKDKYSSRYPFSGKIRCGLCKAAYVARTRKGTRGQKELSWKCLEAVRRGKAHETPDGKMVGCNAASIKNREAELLMMEAGKALIYNRKKFLKDFFEGMEMLITEEKRLKACKKTAESLLEGKEWDDTFYRELLEQMVIGENGKVEIYFRKFPYGFTFQKKENCKLK